MICSDYDLIFASSSTRWVPWHLFEQEVTAAKDLEPYLEKRKNTLAELEFFAEVTKEPLDKLTSENKNRPDYEPYFFRPADYSLYKEGPFVQDRENLIPTYADRAMRKSILYRAQRRRLMDAGLTRDDSEVKELFDKESGEAFNFNTCTCFPVDFERYEDWECFFYTHAQYLIDGYFGSGFRNCVEIIEFPSAAAYNNWAYDLLKCGFYSDALGVLQLALKSDFECYYVWHTMGQVYEALDMMEKAVWAFGEFEKLREK